MYMDSSPPANLSGDQKKLLEELTHGRESADKLQRLLLGRPLGDDKPSVVSADDLLMRILASFTESISVLNRAPIQEVSGKSPANTAGNSPRFQSEDSEGSSKSTSVLKERRGCYKRRKTAQIWTKTTQNLIDDGHAWRKYGQKTILNAKHPRNYYRCTHKFDQGCPATKQVQRTEEDPPMYQTTYHGTHTCQNLHKPHQIILDSTIPGDGSNSVYLSFGSPNHPNTKPSNEIYFPSFPSVKREHSHSLELKPSFNHNQSKPIADTFYQLSASTTMDSCGPMPTVSSESDHDMISSSGAYSCTASTHDDSHHNFDLQDVFGGLGDFDVSFGRLC